MTVQQLLQGSVGREALVDAARPVTDTIMGNTAGEWHT